MQAKDIDDKGVLEFLSEHQGKWTMMFESGFCNWCGDDNNKTCVNYDFLKDVPYKVRLAKMRSLIKRGLVDGCPCGCRGDYEITEDGLKYIGKTK